VHHPPSLSSECGDHRSAPSSVRVAYSAASSFPRTHVRADTSHHFTVVGRIGRLTSNNGILDFYMYIAHMHMYTCMYTYTNTYTLCRYRAYKADRVHAARGTRLHTHTHPSHTHTDPKPLPRCRCAPLRDAGFAAPLLWWGAETDGTWLLTPAVRGFCEDL